MSSPPLTRRQRDIVDFFRGYQAQHGISPTLEEIARHLEVNKVTIFGHIAELERKGVLSKRTPRASRSLELVEPPDVGTSRPGLRLLGKIAAGSPIEALENEEAIDIQGLLEGGKDLYALRVQGNSMIEDCICDGDLVIVERKDTARDGDVVVAVLPDETATLKRLYREKGKFRLQPANATMKPIVVDALEIRGVVVGILRSLPRA